MSTMRIEEIKIQNFRQYENVKIEFPDIYDNDIHIVIGSNGTGKTTLLNAINWCLYGEEPHIFSEEDGLPIVNTKVLETTENPEVIVEITVSFSDNESYIYSRKMIYTPNEKEVNFEISAIENDNVQIIDPRYNDIYVNKFVNELIKEFYFFDGEKLDDYFKKDNMGKIKKNVLEVSNIEKLIKMETHLDIKRRTFRNLSKDKGSDLEELANKIESCESEITENKKELEKTKNILNNTQNERTIIENELQGIPNVDKVKNDIKKLNKRLIDKQEQIDENNNDREKLTNNYLPRILLYEPITAVLDEIQLKLEKNLTLSIDEHIINKSINNCQCELCKNQLEDDEIKYLKQIIQEYKSVNTGNKLLKTLQDPLKSNLNKIHSYESKYEKIIKEGKILSSEYNDIIEDIKDNENQILGYDDEEISKKYKIKLDLDTFITDNATLKGTLEQKIHENQILLDRLNRQYNKELEKDEQTRIIQKKLDLCIDSLDVIKRSKDEIMTKTKETIEKYVNDKFSELLWKKNTYDHIVIDDNYNLQLYHSSGLQGLGSASAAERALLALAYTLGIHSVSGYNSPLIIDTPLSRVSDEHRKNFSESLIKISENKQIILLFTPDEFSTNIQGLFEEFLQYDIVLSSDERTSDIIMRGA